jgi:hypothetical protein
MDEAYFLRHFLEVIRYRCSKSIKNCPIHFPHLDVGSGIRKPIEIVAHMSFVIRCAQSVFENIELNKDMMTWEEEVTQFYNELNKLENYIAHDYPIGKELLRSYFKDLYLMS